jgi:hypothetical protein
MKIKRILILAGLFMMPTAAFANCPSGVCEVEINCTTGVVTYRDAPPRVAVVEAPRPEPIAPTHTLVVQTTTQSLGMSGTPEQIASSVATMVQRVVEVPINPCVNGGCTKVEVNATTQEVTVTALTATEVRQQTDQNAKAAIKNAEMVKKASQALPNIQPIDPLAEKVDPTPLDDLEPEWWTDFLRALAEFYFWYNDVNWWATL